MSEIFQVTYEGPAVESGTIDAAILGESLVNLSLLVSEAQRVLEPESAERWGLTVRSTRPGSFDVILEMKELVGVVINLLNTEPLTAAATLRAIFGGPGLFELLKWLAGRSPDSVEQLDDGTIVRVDSEERRFAAGVGALFVNTSVRKTVTRFAQPLRSDGYDNVRIKTQDYELQLSHQDRPALEAPLDDQIVVDETNTVWLGVEMIRWRSQRWEFKDPITSRLFWATIEDQEFLADVQEAREMFSHGDSLKCRLRTRQWDTGDVDYKTEYSILEVLEHRREPPPVQQRLPED